MKTAEFLETSRGMTETIQKKLDNHASKQVHVMIKLLQMYTPLDAIILFSSDVMYIQCYIFCYQDSNHRKKT